MGATDDETLKIIRAFIANLNNEEQIRVTVIAGTLRGIVGTGHLAELAFSLVGAELAARP